MVFFNGGDCFNDEAFDKMTTYLISHLDSFEYLEEEIPKKGDGLDVLECLSINGDKNAVIEMVKETQVSFIVLRNYGDWDSNTSFTAFTKSGEVLEGEFGKDALFYNDGTIDNEMIEKLRSDNFDIVATD